MITGYVIGKETLLARLSSMPDRVRSALKRAVTEQAVKLQAHVIVNKLTGQVLHVRTGTLRRSINMRVEVEPTKVLGSVGTNVHYGAAWEFGFDRKVGAGARGGPISLLDKPVQLAAYFDTHPPGIKHEGARSFLRSSLADRAPDIRKALRDAVTGSLKP